MGWVSDNLGIGSAGDIAENFWGGVSGESAEEAAAASERAANRAADLQWRMYSQTREDLMPGIENYPTALRSLYGLMGLPYTDAEGTTQEPMGTDIRNKPGYKFRLDEGLKAISRNAGGRGGFGGRNLRDMMQWGQDYASAEYQKEFDRLAQMAGIGSSAAGTVGGIGAKTAENQARSIMHGGDARASGYIGASNAATNFMGNLAGMAGM